MANSEDKSKDKNRDKKPDAQNKTEEQGNKSDNSMQANSTQLEFDTSVFLEISALPDTDEKNEQKMQEIQQNPPKGPILFTKESIPLVPKSGKKPPRKPKRKG